MQNENYFIDDKETLAVISDNPVDEKSDVITKKRPLLVVLQVFVAAVVLVGIFAMIKMYEKNYKLLIVNPYEYLNVTFDGYDGYGEISVSWNVENADERVKNALENYVKIEYESNPDEKISNGDEKIFYLTADENKLKENKVKLNKYSVKYTVEGLKEHTKVELSPYVHVQIYTSDNSEDSMLNLNRNVFSWKDETPDYIKNHIYCSYTWTVYGDTAKVILSPVVDEEFYRMGYELTSDKVVVYVKCINWEDVV